MTVIASTPISRLLFKSGEVLTGIVSFMKGSAITQMLRFDRLVDLRTPFCINVTPTDKSFDYKSAAPCYFANSRLGFRFGWVTPLHTSTAAEISVCTSIHMENLCEHATAAPCYTLEH